jgi:hypothetical protein
VMMTLIAAPRRGSQECAAENYEPKSSHGYPPGERI